MHREQRVRKAIEDLKKNLELAPRTISQGRRALLLATGMSVGAINRLVNTDISVPQKHNRPKFVQKRNRNDHSLTPEKTASLMKSFYKASATDKESALEDFWKLCKSTVQTYGIRGASALLGVTEEDLSSHSII